MLKTRDGRKSSYVLWSSSKLKLPALDVGFANAAILDAVSCLIWFAKSILVELTADLKPERQTYAEICIDFCF